MYSCGLASEFRCASVGNLAQVTAARASLFVSHCILAVSLQCETTGWVEQLSVERTMNQALFPSRFWGKFFFFLSWVVPFATFVSPPQGR